jgi:hypothetical protein
MYFVAGALLGLSWLVSMALILAIAGAHRDEDDQLRRLAFLHHMGIDPASVEGDDL